MKKLILFLLFSPLLCAETPLTVSISPQGAAIQYLSTQQFTVACTYAVHAADDCTAAGGAVWTTSASTVTVSSSGLATAVSDPGSGGGNGALVIVTAGGIYDRAELDYQHPGDTWYHYTTPDYRTYQTTISKTQLPLNVVVGATVAIGSGVIANNSAGTTGEPFQGACTWASSAPAVATVSRIGLVTAVSATAIGDGGVAGAVTITCNITGNAVFGNSSQSGWLTPGNFINLQVVAGDTGSTTWYVRPDGGTPYVNGTQTPYGQCTGKADAAYTGGPTAIWQPNHAYNAGDEIADTNGLIEKVTVAGTSAAAWPPTWPSTGNTVVDNTVTWTAQGAYQYGQACAMGNLRYLYMDQVTYESYQWMIQGGDTVIVRQNPDGYNLGSDAPSGPNPINCNGDTGDCYMPTIPSGTAAKHTRILGENYTSCTADSAKTLLYGTWFQYAMVNTRDSQFVDFACFELTDRAACAGSGNYNNVCTATSNAAQRGIFESALSASDNYTDLFIHGLDDDGIYGSSGVGVIANRVHIRAMPDGGINMDDDPWLGGNMSVAGGFTLTNSITEFTGCVEEYPVVHNYPYIECRDQTTGAYGDGFGTASTTGNWYFDHDIWRYNYQDGLDLLHSGMTILSVTNSDSYGNDGQQYKIGSGALVTFTTNITLHNCYRILDVIGDEPPAAVVPDPTNVASWSQTSLAVSYTAGLAVLAPGNENTSVVPAADITLVASTVNYIWVDPGSSTLMTNTTGFPSGLNPTLRIAAVLTSSTGVSPTPYGGGNDGYSQYNFGVTGCRAGGDGIPMILDGQGTYTFQNNTFAGYGGTSYDLSCAGLWGGASGVCSTANTIFENNINVGMSNTEHGDGQLAALFYTQGTGPANDGWATRDHNLFYNMRNNGGNPCYVGGLQPGELCSSPLLTTEPPLNVTAESQLDGFIATLTASSPAIHTGTHLPAVTTDQVGNAYANPPSMGAYELGGAPPSTVNMISSGHIVFSGRVQF